MYNQAQCALEENAAKAEAFPASRLSEFVQISEFFSSVLDHRYEAKFNGVCSQID